MNRKTITTAALAVTLAGCGAGTKLKADPQAQKSEARALAQVQRCAPKKYGAPDVALLVGRSHRSNRTRFEGCVFPPGRRQAGGACVSRVIFAVRSPAGYERGLVRCVEETA